MKNIIDSTFFEKISCGALICKNDLYSTIITANNAFYNMIGYSKDEMQEKFQNRFSELVVDDLTDILRKVNHTVNSQITLDYEFRIKNKLGEIILIHDVATYDSVNDVFNIIIMDITYRENTLKYIQHLSETDTLSNLLNRRALETKITAMIKSSNTFSQTMILIDLDNFKEINDSMGHLVGDEVISHFGKKLKNIFTKDEIVGRLGGDEFLIYIHNTKSENCIRNLIKRLLKEINFSLNNIAIECSFGVIYDKTAQYNFSELYRLSDSALYKVKKKKKGEFFLKIV
ncbi:MAG: sensor domain-containing diguanylate cyclase [Fusobacteriaceae bacterium]